MAPFSLGGLGGGGLTSENPPLELLWPFICRQSLVFILQTFDHHHHHSLVKVIPHRSWRKGPKMNPFIFRPLWLFFIVIFACNGTNKNKKVNNTVPQSQLVSSIHCKRRC